MSRQTCQELLYNNIQRRLTQVRQLREQRVEHAAYCSLIIGVVDQSTELTRRHGPPIMRWLSETLNPLLRKIVRASDCLIPAEDGVFMIVLPKTPLGGAVRVAERLHKRVQQTRFLYDGVELCLSASLGVSAIHALDTFDVLSDRLCQTLLSILQAGGNRIEVVRNHDTAADRER